MKTTVGRLTKGQIEFFVQANKHKCYIITVQFACCFILTSLRWSTFSYSRFLLQGPSSPGVRSSLMFHFLHKNHSWLVVQHERDDNTCFDEKESPFWPSYAYFQCVTWEKFTQNEPIVLFVCRLCYSFQELWKSAMLTNPKNCAERKLRSAVLHDNGFIQTHTL